MKQSSLKRVKIFIFLSFIGFAHAEADYIKNIYNFRVNLQF